MQTGYLPIASSFKPVAVNKWASVMNGDAIARGASTGYDQQIARSRAAGDQAYQTLVGNYDQIAADAAATRQRNMGRIDQYGQGLRKDLEAQAAQRMAAANQSAIQRGLGNTTILNSLQRGAAFDNTRQQLTLEDQLLQNRIATDSNLSNVYQGVLQNRAQALNSQANQNIGTDNQLVQNGYETVANLYMQQLQLDNANQQAAYDRELRQRQMASTPAYTVSFGTSAMKRPEPIKRGSFVG